VLSPPQHRPPRTESVEPNQHGNKNNHVSSTSVKIPHVDLSFNSFRCSLCSAAFESIRPAVPYQIENLNFLSTTVPAIRKITRKHTRSYISSSNSSGSVPRGQRTRPFTRPYPTAAAGSRPLLLPVAPPPHHRRRRCWTGNKRSRTNNTSNNNTRASQRYRRPRCQ
jgi:hypothetical protein